MHLIVCNPSRPSDLIVEFLQSLLRINVLINEVRVKCSIHRTTGNSVRIMFDWNTIYRLKSSLSRFVLGIGMVLIMGMPHQRV